ncbi:HAD family hydrolase, partial [Rubrivirga sp.]|uniref:HAD family hydrolase n=1 Tax=Rubrivirga sp. TaxID=1885344 RepID=UPI003C73BB14
MSPAASEIVQLGEESWQAFVRVRLEHYRAVVEGDETVRGAASPETAALVRHAWSFACSVALVTTSDRHTTTRVLDALDLADAFDVTVTASDVERTKPDPEYLRALDALGVEAEE